MDPQTVTAPSQWAQSRYFPVKHPGFGAWVVYDRQRQCWEWTNPDASLSRSTFAAACRRARTRNRQAKRAA